MEPFVRFRFKWALTCTQPYLAQRILSLPFSVNKSRNKKENGRREKKILTFFFATLQQATSGNSSVLCRDNYMALK